MAGKTTSIKYFQVTDLILNDLDFSIVPSGDFETDIMDTSDFIGPFFIEGYRELSDGNVSWSVLFSNDGINFDELDDQAVDLDFPDTIFMEECFPAFFKISVEASGNPAGGLTLFLARVNRQGL